MSERTVLLVEDNDDDVFFMKRAVAAAGLAERLDVVTDGQAAIDYLQGEGEFGGRESHPLPFLVFLDLKLPKRPGLEVLAWLRSQPRLSGVLVLVLTSSREESDVINSYRLGANAYLVKPSNGAELTELVRRVKAFWLDNAQLATAG